MQPRFRLALAAIAAAALLAGAPAAAASASVSHHPSWLRPLPSRLYAPYYESYLAPQTPGITATARASGAKFMTMAFLQSKGTRSCAVDWNSAASQPLTYYKADIARLRTLGGDVIRPSADTAQTHSAPMITEARLPTRARACSRSRPSMSASCRRWG